MLSLLGVAGLLVAAGLVLFSLALLIQTTPPAGLVIGIVALLFLVGVERSSVDVAPLVLPATAGATGVIAQVWFERTALPGQYVGVLAFAHVLAIAYAVVAFVRDRLGVDDDAPWVLRADVAGARRDRGRLRRPARRPGAVRVRRADAAVRAARPRHRAGAARRDPPRLDVARAAGGARRLSLRLCVARAPLHARHRHGRRRRRDRDLPAVRGAAVHHDRRAAQRVAPGRRRLDDVGADRAGAVRAVPRRLGRTTGARAPSASFR